MKIRIAVCDDDKIFLDDECNMIHSVLEEQGVEHSIDKFTDSAELLKAQTRYEFVVLDVEMEGIDGIKTAEELRKKNKDCLTFFVTNYEMYLDDAFNQHPFRFWTKPLDIRRLSYGLKCAVDEVMNSHHYIDTVVYGKKMQIPLQNIIYIYMENRRLHIVTLKGEIVSDDTLKCISEQLKDINYFVESCRGY